MLFRLLLAVRCSLLLLQVPTNSDADCREGSGSLTSSAAMTRPPRKKGLGSMTVSTLPWTHMRLDGSFQLFRKLSFLTEVPLLIIDFY